MLHKLSNSQFSIPNSHRMRIGNWELGIGQLVLLCLCVLVFLTYTQARPLQTKAPLQLKFALLVTRHGVRSPTWMPDRLNQYSAEPWPDWGVSPGNLTAHRSEEHTSELQSLRQL